MMKSKSASVMAMGACVLAASSLAVSCGGDSKEPAEYPENDEAMEEAGEEVDEAADEVEDEVDDAEDEIDDETD